MSIQLVLFDIGDVLVKITGAHTLCRLSNKNLSLQDVKKTWLTLDTVRGFETGKVDEITWSKKVIDFYELNATPNEFVREFRDSSELMSTGVTAYLSELGKHYRLACLTNTNPIQWPRIRDESGMGDLFPEQYLSFEIGVMKPDDRAFHAVLEDTDMEPHEILFIDDRESNHIAATRMGFTSIHVIDFEDTKRKVTEILGDYSG